MEHTGGAAQFLFILTEELFGGPLELPVVGGQGHAGLMLVYAHVQEPLDLGVEVVDGVGSAGVHVGPVARREVEQFGVVAELLGHDGVLRVVGFRSRHERLERQQDSPQRQRRRPLVLQDVQADGAGH